jgi:hypothetical protein
MGGGSIDSIVLGVSNAGGMRLEAGTSEGSALFTLAEGIGGGAICGGIDAASRIGACWASFSGRGLTAFAVGAVAREISLTPVSVG